jgi:BlaI family transcriptional regulator, penicillinase repressor
VRQVHEVLSRERTMAYTTALKLLQIMSEKGLVRRDQTERTHVYHTRLSEEQTQRQLIRDLLDRAFGGSSSKLVMQALATRRASAEELGEIRRLIEGRKEKEQETDRESRREVRDDRD